MLILGFITVGTISGTYSVLVQYLIFRELSNLPVLNEEQVVCVFEHFKGIVFDKRCVSEFDVLLVDYK